MYVSESVGSQSWHRLCPTPFWAAVAYILGWAVPILTATLTERDCTPPHPQMKKLRLRGIMSLAKRAAEGWGALLPTDARPTHEAVDSQKAASCSAMI